MEETGVVNFSRERMMLGKEEEEEEQNPGESLPSSDKSCQTDGDDLEVVERALLSDIAGALSSAEEACSTATSKTGDSSRRAIGAGNEPTVSGRGLLAKARNVQDLVSALVKALERTEAEAADLKEQLVEAKKEKKKSTEDFETKVDAANARAMEALERAEDVDYALSATEDALNQLKRVNRVLILENAIAVEELKRHNVMGVEIPLLKLPETYSENNLSGDFKLKVTPLDPTSRKARLEASPIGKTIAMRDSWDPDLTPELKSATTLPIVTTPESQSKLLEKNRRRMLLIDQTPSTPTMAIDTSNTTEAVDALVDDLMTRLNMVDLAVSFRKLADYQYKIGDKVYHLKNINGRLFTRKGGGYQDLLVVLTSFLRFN